MTSRNFLDPQLFPYWGQTLSLSLLVSSLWPISVIAKQISPLSEQPLTIPSTKAATSSVQFTTYTYSSRDLNLALKPTNISFLKQSDIQQPLNLFTYNSRDNTPNLIASISDLPSQFQTLAEAGWTTNPHILTSEAPSSQTSIKSTPPPLAQSESELLTQDQEDLDSETDTSDSLGIPYFIDAEFRGSTRRQFGGINLRLPFWQNARSFAFADVHFEGGSNETFLGNLGLAYRRILNTSEENPWIFGTHAFYDSKRSENGFQYHQGSLGAELVNKKFEFRVNGYLPGSNPNVVGQRTVNGVLGIQPRANGLGTNIVQQTLTLEARERALAGFDFEAGHRHHFNDKVSLGLFGGYFFFDSSETLSIDGPMARAQLEVQDPLGMNGGLLQVGGRFRFDETRGSELEGFVRLGIPFGGPKRSQPLTLTQRLARRPIEREYEITTFAQDINRPISMAELQAAAAGQGTLSPLGPQIIASTSQVALDPATGLPINIFFIDGDGTAGDGTQTNPLTVTQATSAITQTNDVLFFLNDAGAIDTQTGTGGTLSLKEGQQALGVGTTSNFVVTVPNLGSVIVFDTGQPQLINGANNNILTLANNTTIDGLAFNGQNTAPRGIAAVTGATNTTIRNSSFSNFTVAGIQITPSTNTTIDNVVFNNNASDAIINAVNTTLTNVVSTNATGPAFQILNATGTTTLTNIDISNSGGDGLQFANPSGTITAANIDITNAGDNSIDITGGDGTFTFDDTSSITDATSAAFNVVGGTTTVTYNGAITQNNPASAINIADKTGGTTTFNGLVTANTSTAPGVNLTNNTGSTVAFNGGLDIDTTTGTGFNAINGGTVNVAATAADESVTTTAGTAINFNGVMANITFDAVSSTGGTNGINLDTVTGSVGVSGSTTIANATGDGFLATNSTGTYTFGPVAITNAGLDGLDLSGISDATTVFNFGALTINGFTGAGINLAGANVGVTAPTVAITNTGNVGTGIDLSNTTGNRVITLGDPANTAGDTPSSIAGVNVGVQLNNANANFTFGDGELTVDAPSTIVATTPIDASAVGANGTYNFRDVAFAGSPGLGFNLPDLFFVDQNTNGSGTTITDPGNIMAAEASPTADIFILVNTSGADLIDAINAGGSFDLTDNQQLFSFLNSSTLNIPFMGPGNVLLNASAITVTDTTTNGAPTLTTTGMSSATVTLANNNQIVGVDINAMGTNGIEAVGVDNVVINQSRITNADNGIRLQNVTGNLEITNNVITQATDDGIDLGLNNTNLNNVLISGNTVSNSGDEGIDVDVYNNSQLNSVTISGNTVSEVGAEASGVSLNVNNNGQTTSANITDNTVSTSADSATGITVQSFNNGTITTANISGNTVSTSSNYAAGIFVQPLTNSTITTANISGNTISTSGNYAYGIAIQPVDGATITSTTISGNIITTSGIFSNGILTSVVDNSTITNTTISGNTVTSSGANNDSIYATTYANSTITTATFSNNIIPQAGRDGIQVNNAGGNPICTSFSGNRSDNPAFTTAGGADINLIASGTTFQVVDLANVSANNNNAIFSFDGTLVPPGVPLPPFTNVGACP
ncbi:right-handed parallel beta-helix repeat-containing protein [Acaryochloris marina NIES-2412]|uniref:right-handed parallel beta-helix repeat-containing protein n=1 Tax=Acaryochloris marina TaxID=155978 RepID=UPI004059E9B6